VTSGETLRALLEQPEGRNVEFKPAAPEYVLEIIGVRLAKETIEVMII
jgi:hypothetical protein